MCILQILWIPILCYARDGYITVIKGVLHSGSASVSHTEGRGFDSLHLHDDESLIGTSFYFRQNIIK